MAMSRVCNVDVNSVQVDSMAQVNRLGLRVCSRRVMFYIHQMKQVNWHNNSTINSVLEYQ